MTNETIIGLVSSYMDDITPVSDNENMVNVINPLIPAHLDFAAYRLLEILPVNQQQVFSPTETLRVIMKSDHLLVTCPLDFIKLSSVKLAGWGRSVTGVALDGSVQAQTQAFKFMAGRLLRPTAVLTQQTRGGYYIELRPPSSNTIEQFLYVKRRAANELEDNLIDPLVYLTAARVYETIREFDSAKTCYEQLNRFIQSNAIKSTNQ